MGGVVKESQNALRGLIAALAFVGAASVFYTWNAPWIVSAVDNLKTFSDVLYGWVPIETSPEARLSGSFLLIFAVAGFGPSLAQALKNRPRGWVLLNLAPLFFTGVAIVFPIILAGVQLPEQGAERLQISLILITSTMFYVVSWLNSPRFTIWFTACAGAAFLLDYTYRNDWLELLTPAVS